MAGVNPDWVLGFVPLGGALCLAAARRLMSPKQFAQSLSGLSLGVLTVFITAPMIRAVGHG